MDMDVTDFNETDSSKISKRLPHRDAQPRHINSDYISFCISSTCAGAQISIDYIHVSSDMSQHCDNQH